MVYITVLSGSGEHTISAKETKEEPIQSFTFLCAVRLIERAQERGWKKRPEDKQGKKIHKIDIAIN